MKTLLEMLTYARPYGSAEDEEFVTKYFDSLAEHPNVTDFFYDELGNRVFVVAGGSTTLFCAHSDTVHAKGGRQTPEVREDTVYAPKGEVLGADDTVGCWLLREIILAGVPSTCVLTRGEERGGIGSTHMAEAFPQWLRGFDRAIALDRGGFTSVITHQGRCGNCCSTEFAEALAANLNDLNEDFFFMPDSTGVYTDTAEWAHLIPECTNLSVGYSKQHTQSETTSLSFAQDLRDALVQVDWKSLPTVRDPKKGDMFGINFRSLTNVATLSAEDVCAMSNDQLYNVLFDAMDFDDIVTLVRGLASEVLAAEGNYQDIGFDTDGLPLDPEDHFLFEVEH